MAVNMVGGRGDECKRERGHGSFAGDETFLFWESESVLSRYCQFYVVLLSVLEKACVGESTRADKCIYSSETKAGKKQLR